MAMSELKLIVDQAVEEMGGWNDAAMDRWSELSGVDVRAINDNTPFDIDVANRLLATFPQVLEELMAGPTPVPEEPTPEEVITDLSEMAQGLGEALGMTPEEPKAPEAEIPEVGIETGVSEEVPAAEEVLAAAGEAEAPDSSSIDALIKELESLAVSTQPTLKEEVPTEAPAEAVAPEEAFPAEIPVEAKAPEEAPVSEAPVEIPVEAKAPEEAPVSEAPVEIPVEAKTPEEAPVSEAPVEIPVEAKAPEEAPEEIKAEEAPVEAGTGPAWEIPAPVAEELEKATRIMDEMEVSEYNLSSLERRVPGYQAACVLRDGKVVARHSKRDVDWTALSQAVAAANGVFKGSLGIEEHFVDELVMGLGNLFVLGFLVKGVQVVVVVKSDRLGAARAYVSSALKDM